MHNKVGRILGILTIALGAWAVMFADVAKATEDDYMYLQLTTGTAIAGSAVTATVTLNAGDGPGGSPITADPVEFQVFSDSTCTGSAVGTSTQTLNGSGQAQTTYATGAGGLGPGPYSVLSTYNGSETYAPVTVCVPFVVDQAVPTVSQIAQKRDLSASGGPSITNTATVVGDDPSGSVTFQFFTNATCSGSPALTETASLSNGTSSQTYTPPSAGAYGVTAAYSGDSNNLSASSGCTESTIDQATPTVSTSLAGPGPEGALPPGDGAAASAIVSGGYKTSSGGGTITFAFFASKANCQAATDALYTSGPASLGSNSTATSGTYVPSMPGTYYVRTTYSGDTNNAPASDLCTKSFTVAATTTTTTTTTPTNPTPTTTSSLNPTPPSSHGPTPPVETGNDDGPLRWLAAGDSYSSGEGLPHTQGGCARPKPDSNSKTWATVAWQDLGGGDSDYSKPQLVACSGSTTSQFFSGNHDNPTQWTPKQGKYDLVTFTFGGDDLGFAPFLEKCLWTPTFGRGCPSESATRKQISSFGRTYKTFLRKVADKVVKEGGNILALDYPELIEDPSLWSRRGRITGCGHFTVSDANEIRGLAGDLNATIGSDVRAINREHPNGVHLTFVDVVSGGSLGIARNDRNLFEPSSGPRHEICSSQPWINPISLIDHFIGSYHPKQAGLDAEGQLAADGIEHMSW